jgi:hypothetical protein
MCASLPGSSTLFTLFILSSPIQNLYPKMHSSRANLKLLNTDFRQPFMFHQKIHNFLSKPDDQYCFLKNISL